MRQLFIILFGIFFIANDSYGQLSEGGFPLQVISLKSARSEIVKMPVLKQSVVDKEFNENITAEDDLKPFRFAHAFEVSLDAGNSGNWYATSAKYNVWRIKIQSLNARSLNLIFDNFKLREGARLFIYNEKKNKYLGAFTSKNNRASMKFAIAPVAGDEITVQYEVPEKSGTPVDFVISRVNHDFVGVVNFDRRPYYGQAAGDCNIDINCGNSARWNELKNSVCRLIVNGTEICSGTLINNTSQDRLPYVISAAHCYDEWDFAETTVYTFNYESPYCAPLDGDPIHSLSGAVMKSTFDSLDFALVQLDEIPPPDFRPYYAGWDRSSTIPDSSVSIHHPLGDIKKIAFENDPLEKSSFPKENPYKKYIKMGFWRIAEWDAGVTEIGSSGGGLFNTNQQLIGTLTGGNAICGTPFNDYYSRIDMQWDYKSDSTKQLKCWLDPGNTGITVLDGKHFDVDANFCKAFTNLVDSDEHATIALTVGGESNGYWGGTNGADITEFMERFLIPGNETLDGISFGVGKLLLQNKALGGEITLKVYNGNAMPENLIHSQIVDIRNFAEDAMNFVSFDGVVEPADTFFVGFELSHINAQDTFVVFQSLRENSGAINDFYFKQNNVWHNFKESNQQNYAMVNVMELVACNVDELTDTPVVNLPVNVWVYPNPTQSEVVVESDQELNSESISVYNLIGQKVDVPLVSDDPYRIRLNLSGNTMGVYFVRFTYGKSFVTRKISFVGQ